MNVLQHCVSGQRSGVSSVSAGVLDALGVSAGETDEGRALTVSTDAVHHSRSVHNIIRYQCERDHILWLAVSLHRCWTNALSTSTPRSVGSRHVHHD